MKCRHGVLPRGFAVETDVNAMNESEFSRQVSRAVQATRQITRSEAREMRHTERKELDPREVDRRLRTAHKRRLKHLSPDKPRMRRFWTFLNSPFFLTLLTGVLLAGALKIYDDRQRAAADLDLRRASYVELLAEIQLRVSRLDEADARLNEFITDGRDKNGATPLPKTGPRRAEFERTSIEVGKLEAEILAGRGTYLPTAPAYANVDMLTLASRLEHLGGVPDYYAGSLRMLRVLDAPSEILWIFVRAYMPMLREFVVRRHLLYTSGELPLPAGGELTAEQKRFLGIRKPRPGELEELIRTTNAHLEKLQKDLRIEKN